VFWGALCRLRELRISGLNRFAFGNLIPLGSPYPEPLLGLNDFLSSVIQEFRLLGSGSTLMLNAHGSYSSTPVTSLLLANVATLGKREG
jgi:hypothetical protein